MATIICRFEQTSIDGPCTRLWEQRRTSYGDYLARLGEDRASRVSKQRYKTSRTLIMFRSCALFNDQTPTKVQAILRGKASQHTSIYDIHFRERERESRWLDTSDSLCLNATIIVILSTPWIRHFREVCHAKIWTDLCQAAQITLCLR